MRLGRPPEGLESSKGEWTAGEGTEALTQVCVWGNEEESSTGMQGLVPQQRLNWRLGSSDFAVSVPFHVSPGDKSFMQEC